MKGVPEAKRKLVLEHILHLKEHGGTDSDIRDFCEENGVSFRTYEKIIAEETFRGTACEGCPNNLYNLGSMWFPCNACRDNPRFKSYRGAKLKTE